MSANILDGVLGANQIYKNEEGTEVNFDNDVYRAGLNLVKETLDKGYAIPIEDEFSEDISVANTFLQGKCAIMLGRNPKPEIWQSSNGLFSKISTLVGPKY